MWLSISRDDILTPFSNRQSVSVGKRTLKEALSNMSLLFNVKFKKYVYLGESSFTVLGFRNRIYN